MFAVGQLRAAVGDPADPAEGDPGRRHEHGPRSQESGHGGPVLSNNARIHEPSNVRPALLHRQAMPVTDQAENPSSHAHPRDNATNMREIERSLTTGLDHSGDPR